MGLAVVVGLCFSTIYYRHGTLLLKEKIYNCETLINVQNSGILEMQRRAKVEEEKQKELEKEIAAEKEAAYKRLEEIKSETTPEECKAAVQWAADKIHSDN